ncbi:ATP-dependent Clp protease adapter ClpS [Dermacoccus abyssi]
MKNSRVEGVSIAPPDIDFDELTEQLTRSEPHESGERAWVTLVWNDPVNLMSYVSFVFQDYFGYSEAEAERLMMQVHTEGRAVVSKGSRERMEADTIAMHGYSLWATYQQEG